jgi:hypothetical protein
MAGKILVQGSMIRAAYGLLALLFPKVLSAGAGMSEDDVDPDARYLNRLFGGRDLLVAGLTATAVRAGDERHAANITLICEATDTISLLEELRARGRMDRTLAIGLVFNVVGYATTLRALRSLSAD